MRREKALKRKCRDAFFFACMRNGFVVGKRKVDGYKIILLFRKEKRWGSALRFLFLYHTERSPL